MSEPPANPRPQSAHLGPAWTRETRPEGVRQRSELLILAKRRKASLTRALAKVGAGSENAVEAARAVWAVAKNPEHRYWPVAIEIILDRMDGPLLRAAAPKSDGGPSIVLQVSPGVPIEPAEPESSQVFDTPAVVIEPPPDISAG